MKSILKVIFATCVTTTQNIKLTKIDWIENYQDNTTHSFYNFDTSVTLN